MGTLLSLVLALMACTIGLLAAAIGILLMGLAGAPGAALYEIGKKNQNCPLRAVGVVVAGIGQAFIVACYCIVAVSLLRYALAAKPGLAAWPLWFAAFFHAIVLPGSAVKETKANDTAQFVALPVASLAAIVTFVMCVVSPEKLQPAFGWLPWFRYLLGGDAS